MFNNTRLRKLASKLRYKKRIDFHDYLRANYPDNYELANEVTQTCVGLLEGVNYDFLAVNSPGLKDTSFDAYLNASCIRLLELAKNLKKAGVTSGRILDCGGYFGNFSIFLSKLGYQVDAVDSFKEYGECFAKNVKEMQANGVNIIDYADVTYDLKGLEEQYDVIISMGVIEHVPHTPRFMLEAFKRTLKPGGLMVIETPNLSYIYNIQKFAKGLSPFPPIELQFETEIPFVGHHREYTKSEIQWMVKRMGFKEVYSSMYFYSLYMLPYLMGLDLRNYKIMLKSPEYKELIMVLAAKPMHEVTSCGS